MATFSERFRYLRERTGWTQDDAAARLGVSRSTIAGYESDSKGRVPREDMLIKIADVFGVSTDYLHGISDDPSRSGHSTDPSMSPEEAEFLKWVKEKVTGSFFYDWHQSQNKDEYMESLRLIWKLEKGRKPGQKQGE